MSASYRTHRSAALALLNSEADLNRRCGQFLGQIACDPDPLSERQLKWLTDLLRKHGMPPLAEEVSYG